jgi:glycosyltransferase involved in cell wall biosynthesis
MKVTIAINNFNYENYILQCVDSALNQTYKNIEILVIDDGSTDKSSRILSDKYSSCVNVKLIFKENGGQLSAFNEILKHCSSELIFFLDADDLYKDNYIEEAVKVYKNNPDIDFVFCAYEEFHADGNRLLKQQYRTSRDLGYSLLSTCYTHEWLGGVTSTVSMRYKTFSKFMPVGLEKDWITRADDCLVWGASISGAKKYYLAESCVFYRIHDSNHFHGKIISSSSLFKREVNINRLFKYLLEQTAVSINDLKITELEYKSRSDGGVKVFKRYFLVVLRQRDFWMVKLKKVARLLAELIRKNFTFIQAKYLSGNN